MPIIMFYGALALPTPGMLALAFCRRIHVGRAACADRRTGMLKSRSGGRSSSTRILGALMGGFRPLFQRGRWEIHCLLSGVCTSIIVLAEYLMITFRREPVVFIFNQDVWWQHWRRRPGRHAALPLLFLCAELPRFSRRLRSPAGSQGQTTSLIWPAAFPADPSAELRMLFLAFMMLCGLGVLVAKLW